MFLRDQPVGEERQLEFASGFGKVSVYPVLKLLGIDKPLETIEDSEESPPGADTWHTDVTWIECPPKVAMICALDIPEYGGDTMWANMHAAYDALSEPMRGMLDGLSCVHGLGEDFYSRVESKAGAEIAQRIRDELGAEVEHPLIRRHPETGRPSLFLAGGFLKRIAGMTPEESRALLDFLTAHANQPRFHCRWKWQEGDVAIWDERCTLHHALPDHYPQHRAIRRCTVEGERPA